jgi:membrane protease YdiL (CAAX protease family)
VQILITGIPLAMLQFLPLQTTFEELMIRGYLAQGIGAWTKTRWMVIVISITFAVILKHKYKWYFSILNIKIEPDISIVTNKIIPDPTRKG